MSKTLADFFTDDENRGFYEELYGAQGYHSTRPLPRAEYDAVRRKLGQLGVWFTSDTQAEPIAALNSQGWIVTAKETDLAAHMDAVVQLGRADGRIPG